MSGYVESRHLAAQYCYEARSEENFGASRRMEKKIEPFS